MKRLTLFLIALMACLGIYAQDVSVSGTVVSQSDGEPLIGASVLVKGAKGGVATDFDGKFTIKAQTGSTLLISYIGYTPKEVKVQGNMSGLTISLLEDAQILDEVVAIGYGTQKKSVVTAAISTVNSETLEQTAPLNVANALKGVTAGVTATTANGQPGATAQIRVRGVGTINDSNPLYIVDGMPIEGGIDYLNPNDIKSIEVLKDAASGAVYGARAANGVILVTTKSGQAGRAKVTYDFSYGWQSKQKTVDMLNATQYAIMKNEGYMNIGQPAPYADPYSYGAGFDWQKAIFNDNAPVMNHQLSVSGASEKVNYYLSLGYYDQEGIIGGNYNQSNYNRLTLRSNNTYTLMDESKKRNYLNKFVLTTNLSYARIHSVGFGGGGAYYGAPITNALGMSPMLTPLLAPGSDLYNEQLAYYAGNEKYVPRYNKEGYLYMIPEAHGGGYQELDNPFYRWSFPAGKNWSHKFVTNIIGELQLWDGISYRISFGGDLAFWGGDSHSEPSYYTNLVNTDAIHASASSNMNRGWVWQVENILQYDKTFGSNHINVVLGQSGKQSSGWWINASANKLYNFDKPWVTVAQGAPGEADGGNRTGNAGPNSAWPKLLSYFGRVSYDYAGRYMAQVTMRRDGSSRFGANHKWATFPSFSLGWNPTSESFLENRPNWWSHTKVRLSWGKNGNESIGDFAYTVLTTGNNNYYFGPEGVSSTYGSKASGLANPDLKWEESTQTDFGLDFGFFDNSLQFNIDWYKKTTNGMLMTMMIPTYVGETKPIGNVGKMENTGVEMNLLWAHNFGPVEFNIGGNLSYVKNRLVNLGNADGWRSEVSNATAGDIARSMNGEVFPFFYGYKTAGLFQNQEQADAYNQKYGLNPGNVAYYAQPGDVIFVDTNNDGQINADDRTKIGKGMPDWTYGFNLGAGWKGFQLTAYFQGVWGNQIYDASLRGDTPAKNLPSWMLNRWTGEGTSNKIPVYRLADSRNWQSSDLYIHSGAYLRCANLTLSYTLPANLTRKVGVDNFRVYLMGENLFTATKYHGFTPEVGDGTSIGIDYGNYPEARTYTIGFNLSF
ncbi:MAG: TonB-dependent receptor [Muribaculaceae bacterium]|nr:TonB-dependent receptor [Muribaculaceae bacterium]